MMHWDVVTLARVQFAFTILFHYLFPPLTIGLGLLLVVMEGLYLKTKNPIYEVMTQFWTKIFALNFAMGVATGIVMEFQFGSNWANFSSYVGDVFGAALASEGIFAFFLESGFLAVLLFGWHRVSPKVHFFSTIMVAFGALFSAFWITVANSWQQIPVAYHLVHHGTMVRAEITDFWGIVFGPSCLPRFFHAVLGGGMQAAFFVMSISAFYLLKNRCQGFAQRSFLIALIAAALFSPLQALTGSYQGELVAKYQPAKLAAMEAHFQTSREAPEFLFGIPDEKTETVHFPVAIPGLLSLLATHDIHAQIKGLSAFPKADRPPVLIPFISFHLMVFIGTFLIGLSWLGLYLFKRNQLFQQPWILWVFVFSVIGPYLANEMGWITTEVGRQPWLVYGLLRTSQGVSQAVHPTQVLISLLMFTVIYGLLFCVFVYSLDRKIKHGPEALVIDETETPGTVPVQTWLSLNRLDTPFHRNRLLSDETEEDK